MTSSSVARVDLDAITSNLAAVRARVGGRLVLAAVKADAYGHGAVPVARQIQATAAADYLGVATVGEGVELREAGIRLPILKLSPCCRDEIAAAVVAELTITVADEAGIRDVAAAAAAHDRTARVHLKVDTGMRRVGCPPAAAPALAEAVDAAPGLALEGVFSHLAVSDVPEGADFTAAQIATFSRTVAEITAVRGPVTITHLANSGGILGHPDSWFDMVRPGITVYGSYPDPGSPRSVEIAPALSWHTRVMFVKPVAAGETVSYGRTWTAPRDTWVATLAVGYGDGFNRLLSNRGRVLIGGRAYPIVGRVCMDQTMVDLGPQTDVRAGDEVILIGRDGECEITAADLARLTDTIPYEVTCVITHRVRRLY